MSDELTFSRLRQGTPTVIRGRRLTDDDVNVISQLDAALASYLTMSSRWPAQPPVGSILRWERRFSSNPEAHAYTYVALRATDDQWYVTGRSKQSVTDWPGVQQLISNNPCWIVTEYKEIPRHQDPIENIDNPRDWWTAAYGGGVEHDPGADNKEQKS